MRVMVMLICLLGLVAPYSHTVLASPLAGQSERMHTDDATTRIGPLDHAIQWMLAKQRELHRKLSYAMQEIREAPGAATVISLILISFFYGIFHAAGPGHGKAVITTYLLTHGQMLRRGVALSFLSALLQGVSAILLVFVLVKLAGWLTRDALSQVSWLEQFSFLLVTLLGLWLLWRSIRNLLIYRRVRIEQQRTKATTPSKIIAIHPVSPAASSPQPAPAPHQHDAHCGCGKAHHVDPAHLADADIKTMLAVVLAVGIRPCTGAVLVLAVAHLLDLWLAGVMAVLAMSMGTGITVSLLAIFAVKARSLASRMVGGTHPRWHVAGHLIAVCGGLVIFIIGLGLLYGSAFISTPTHPLQL